MMECKKRKRRFATTEAFLEPSGVRPGGRRAKFYSMTIVVTVERTPVSRVIFHVTTCLSVFIESEAYYWSSMRKEQKMHSILNSISQTGVRTASKKTSILDCS
jgi:hypothetical protein